jgi:hypothetical protein
MPSLRLTVISAVPVNDQAAATLTDHAGRADYIIFTKRIPPKPAKPDAMQNADCRLQK